MTAGRRLGIVTGLPAEARVAGGGANIRVMCSDSAPARARAHAQTLAAWGANGLASFGVAGGLDPGLRPGTIVLATRIVGPGGEGLGIDEDWADRLAAVLPPELHAVRAPVAGADEPVADAAAKAALGSASGAAAVDMESHAVARSASGLPIIALRAIADTAARDLPASALALRGAAPVRALPELCRRPGDLPVLAALALDYRRALAALRRVIAAGGADLGFFG